LLSRKCWGKEYWYTVQDLPRILRKEIGGGWDEGLLRGSNQPEEGESPLREWLPKRIRTMSHGKFWEGSKSPAPTS